MIAHRLRPVGWVAAVALAALCFYLVSLRVAAERAALESTDHAIAAAERDIRRLGTELATRGSLHQLERWNREVLALSAPGAGQYLKGQLQLAAFAHDVVVDAVAAPMQRASAQAEVETMPQLVPAVLTEDAAPVIDPAPRLIRASHSVIAEASAPPPAITLASDAYRPRAFGSRLRADLAQSAAREAETP